MSWPIAMAIAMVIDVLVGWPAPLFNRIGHPVTWIGALVKKAESYGNLKPKNINYAKTTGVISLIIILLIVFGVAWTLIFWLPDNWIGTLMLGILAWPLIAVRSLHEHGVAVVKPMMANDLPKARVAVSMIVGRDPSQLDEAGVGRAAIESIAENTSDGIVAPVFWGALLGLPGLVLYKAINTLDSMIGHKNEEYLYFGWASARLDDLVNLIPSRLTGLLFTISSSKPIVSFKCILKDAHKHRSPNAGWPESAMAGALGVRLSGPRKYDGIEIDEPWVNEGARNPQPVDLEHGLALYRRAMVVLWLMLLVWAVSW